MILSHFSTAPLVLDLTREYKPYRDDKPHGLWLSDESAADSWSWWCNSEDFRLENLSCKANLVCDTGTWLVLDSVPKLLSFSAEYCEKDTSIPWYDSRAKPDWARVMSQFGGILISPYQWTLRMDDRCGWYYTWDCASACVWDLTTIECTQNRSAIQNTAVGV